MGGPGNGDDDGTAAGSTSDTAPELNGSTEGGDSNFGVGLGANALGRARQAVREAEMPTEIGPWRTVRFLGEGGFGVVYEARRTNPSQAAAVKLIKPGMDTRAVLARFKAEQEALSMMTHPNIARLLDAGTHEGRPYFAMEFVRGLSITGYADRHRLTLEARLRLFQQVCRAVQHAHHKAVIHRDISAKNVMVTEIDGMASVKVIDFGIAKALGRSLADSTFASDPALVIGNYDYMSPEQADPASDVDTRTDVYSLGVLLYELLTGERPFDSRELRLAGDEGVRRHIRDIEPPKPSTRLSRLADAAAVAARRRMKLESLVGTLRGELEWIPMRAVRKERERRYQTPEELAADIENYLSNRSLNAAPESRVYRARKFLKRHAVGVGIAAGFLVVCALGTAGVTWQWRVATRERAVAEDHRDRAEMTSQYLVKLMSRGSPMGGGDRNATVLEAVKLGIRELDGGIYRDRSMVEAELRIASAEMLLGGGAETDEVLAQAEKAIKLLEEDTLRDSEQLVRAYCLASRMHLGRDEEKSVLFYQKAVAMARRVYPSDHLELARTLLQGAYAFDRRDRREAETCLRQSEEMLGRLVDADPEDVELRMERQNSQAMRAEWLLDNEEAEEAARYFRRALAECEWISQRRNVSTRVASHRVGLGRALAAGGRHLDAINELETALALRLEAFGELNMPVVQVRAYLADTLMHVPERRAEAVAMFAAASAGVEMLWDDANQRVQRAVWLIWLKRGEAETRLAVNDFASAKHVSEQALDAARLLVDRNQADSSVVVEALVLRARCEARLGELDTADASLQEAEKLVPDAKDQVNLRERIAEVKSEVAAVRNTDSTTTRGAVQQTRTRGGGK